MLRHLRASLVASLLLVAPAYSQVQPGVHLEELTVRKVTYRDLTVKKVSHESILLAHPGGLLTLKWEEAPSGWLASRPFPSLASLRPSLTPRSRPTPLPAARRPEPDPEDAPSLGELNPEGVDFRPFLREQGLWVKNQGRRPSCTLYALVSSLELSYALRTGRALRFDDDHLVKAAGGVLGRPLPYGTESDLGISLAEAIKLVEKVGLKLSDDTLAAAEAEGLRTEQIFPPSDRLRFIGFPDAPAAELLPLLVRALNAKLPVVIGVQFPPAHACAGGLLDTQEPSPRSLHAVSLVGYENPTGRWEDVVYLFKNSWGPQWGSSGYGRITAPYLATNLYAALVPDWQVSPPEEAP